MYGARVHRAVLGAGRRDSGPTVHFVDEVYDHGAVIAQWPVPVLAGDDEHTLAARVLRAEHLLYPRVVRRRRRRARCASTRMDASRATRFTAPRLPTMDPALDDVTLASRLDARSAADAPLSHPITSHASLDSMPRALLSVSDKTGLLDFARGLARARLGARLHRRHGARAARGRRPGPRRRATSRSSPRCSTAA